MSTDRMGMWEVADAVPGPLLRPGVRTYRGFRFALSRPRRRLEVPVNVVTLVLNFDGNLRLTNVAKGNGRTCSFTSLVSGLRTGATLGEHDGAAHGIEVNLQPWAGFTLFALPMWELKDTTVEASDLLGTRVQDLTAALAAIPHWRGRFALLDHVLSLWWAAGPESSPRVVHAWRTLRRTGGAIPIPRLAAVWTGVSGNSSAVSVNRSAIHPRRPRGSCGSSGHFECLSWAGMPVPSRTPAAFSIRHISIGSSGR